MNLGEMAVTEQNPIRVMTVDDHEIMRGGIHFVLLAFDDLELVAEARSGEEALRLCGSASPDVVLMDLKMPKMDGIATTKAMKEQCPNVQVVVLTSFHDTELVQQAMNVGAIGYLLKDASKEEIAGAIRAAKNGQVTLSPDAARDLVQDAKPEAQLENDLTEREQEILVLLAKGLNNNEIAKQLSRSPHTIRHHVSQILAKLGAANRAEAVAVAAQHGLIR